MENKEKSYVEELIRIIRPTTKNHVFNEVDYDRTESYGLDGIKIVLLREKELNTPSPN